MRGNATLIVLVGLAALIVAVFILPGLRDAGHPWMSAPLFVFLGLLLVYGRRNPVPRARKKDSVPPE